MSSVDFFYKFTIRLDSHKGSIVQLSSVYVNEGFG